MNQTEKNQEAAKAARTIKADIAERKMRGKIRWYAVLFMAIIPVVVCFLLRGICAYVDNDLAVLHPSTAMTVLQWILYYSMLLCMSLFQCAGFGILGYSVLRYGVKKSIGPILLSLLSATITCASGIAEMFYTHGIYTVRSNLPYLLPYWLLNYFLSLFTTLCIIFLCAMLRISFIRHGRLRIGITKEPKETRQKNVLRRLYLYITLLLLAFNLISGGMSTYAEVRKVGGPEDFWDFFTLIEPYIETLLLSALGFFMELRIGTYLTNVNAEVEAEVSSI